MPALIWRAVTVANGKSTTTPTDSMGQQALATVADSKHPSGTSWASKMDDACSPTNMKETPCTPVAPES